MIPWHLDWRGGATAREKAKWEEYDAVAHRVAEGVPLESISMARSVEREIDSCPEMFEQLVRGHRSARMAR